MPPRQAASWRAAWVAAGQRVEPAAHQLGEVVGVALGADPGDVPPPAGGVAIEPDRALVVEGGEELDGEERVAAGLLADEGGEGRGLGGRGVDGVGDEPAEVVLGERAEHEVADPGAAPAHGLERAHQRVRRVDLVVAEGADDEEVAGLAVGHEVGEEAEAGGVCPLEIVDEHGERVLGGGAGGEQAAEQPAEAGLALGERQLGDGRLGPDDEAELGDEIDDQLAALAERLGEARAPAGEAGARPRRARSRARAPRAWLMVK